MKVCVFNLGCKVNQYESDCLIQMFEDKGYEVSEKLEPADYYIFNTCAVTAEAEKKSRQCVARAKRQNPNAKILICGCAAENNPSQFDKEGIIYVSGTAGKDLLADIPELGVNVTEIPKKYEEYGDAKRCRTRAYVKIQDGCNTFCSYCLIPYVRGRSRSRELSAVVNEVNDASKTVGEVVLTGIDISSYGKDTGLSLKDLIVALKDVDVRIRLGSFEVNVIDDALLTALKDLKKFCPHFHLSLQSGSDLVLKSMNRHYTTREYLDKVNLIRGYFPIAGITTDVIVGFPTETDTEFENSLSFIKSVGFADIHCFPYSARRGTVAYKQYKTLPPETVDKRMDRLLQYKKVVKNEFAILNLNVRHTVLFEDKEESDFVGYTENYVKFYKKDTEEGKIENVVGNEVFNDGIK